MAEESTNPQVKSVGCSFFLIWILVTVIGTGLGWLAGWWVSFQVPGELSTLVLGLVVGLLLGAMQWLVLRGYLAGAGWWTLAGALGWGAGFYLGTFLAYSGNLSGISFGPAVGATVGLTTGVLQWFLLRWQTRHAIWWIPASVFGWASALLFFQAGMSGFGLYYGLLVGMVTGLAMVGILSFN